MGFLLIFRRYAPFAKFGFGFEGDDRTGPSVSMKDKARTMGVVPFERQTIGSIRAETSGTEFLGLGNWIRKIAGEHKSNVSCSLSNATVRPNSISFSASTAGANPMIPFAPEIDTFVNIRIEWVGTGIRFQGSVYGDDFPNAEIFVLDSKTTGCLLFDGRTTGGQDIGPITRLAGSHETQRLGSFACSIGISPSGEFFGPKTSCPITKMELVAGRRVAWTNAGGQYAGGGASSQW